MATRSTIALEFADGTVEQVYCHWDGYLDHNGKILQEHYSNPFKLKQLIQLGALSGLGREIGEKHAFDNPGQYGSPEYIKYREETEHMCLFYARDRGEALHVNKFKDFEDYKQNAQFEEYNYILRQVNGKAVWYVEFHGEFNGLLVEAFEHQALEKEE